MSLKFVLSNSLDILYFVTDSSGKITSSNELFKEYTSHIKPNQIDDIVTEQGDLDEILTLVSKAKTNNLTPVRSYFQVKQKNGSLRWNLFNIVFISNNLHFIGFTIIDVTSITSHEHEKQKILLDEFRFMLSHEIRSPLASMQGLVKLLLEKNEGEDISENLELLKIINQQVVELDAAIAKLVKKVGRQF